MRIIIVLVASPKQRFIYNYVKMRSVKRYLLIELGLEFVLVKNCYHQFDRAGLNGHVFGPINRLVRSNQKQLIRSFGLVIQISDRNKVQMISSIVSVLLQGEELVAAQAIMDFAIFT